MQDLSIVIDAPPIDFLTDGMPNIRTNLMHHLMPSEVFVKMPSSSKKSMSSLSRRMLVLWVLSAILEN
jgi:hypothetical protein